MADNDQPELWDKYQAATHLGIQPDSVRQWASRRRIPVIQRRIDKRGRAHALYYATDIRHHSHTA